MTLTRPSLELLHPALMVDASNRGGPTRSTAGRAGSWRVGHSKVPNVPLVIKPLRGLKLLGQVALSVPVCTDASSCPERKSKKLRPLCEAAARRRPSGPTAGLYTKSELSALGWRSR